MAIDFAASEAVFKTAQARLADGFTAQGIDPKTLPPGELQKLLDDLLAFLATGGCVPAPAKTPAEIAAEAKTTATDYPLISQRRLTKRNQSAGLSRPSQSASASLHALGASTADEVAGWITLDVSL